MAIPTHSRTETPATRQHERYTQDRDPFCLAKRLERATAPAPLLPAASTYVCRERAMCARGEAFYSITFFSYFSLVPSCSLASRSQTSDHGLSSGVVPLHPAAAVLPARQNRYAVGGDALLQHGSRRYHGYTALIIKLFFSRHRSQNTLHPANQNGVYFL